MEAVTVDAVVEVGQACSDRQAAESGLAALVNGARGPRRGDGRPWRLELSIDKLAGGGRQAVATITDDTGAVVSERTVKDPTAKTCAPVAKAVGAWATLVLDDAMARATREDDAAQAAAAPTPRAAAPTPTASTVSSSTASTEPATPDVDRAAPPAHTFRFDVGMGMMVRSGFGAGTIAAAAPFVAFEVAPGWLLRPSIALGSSTTAAPAGEGLMLSLAAARVDACRRIPGNYIDRRGIELDLCAGSDFGVVWDGDVVGTRATVGPSATLRGDLGADLAAEVRGMGGFAFEQSRLRGDATSSRFGGAAEVGLSMRIR